jgi:hypothetical protein
MTFLSPTLKSHLTSLALAASMALSLTSAALGQGGLPDPGFDVTLGNAALTNFRMIASHVADTGATVTAMLEAR